MISAKCSTGTSIRTHSCAPAHSIEEAPANRASRGVPADCESACEAGPGSNRVIPEAAEALPTISRDRRTYVFTIRKGLRFSDGTPVTAAHFAFGLARAFGPGFGSPAAFMSDIVGAKSVIEGRAVTLAGVRARGRTLTISLTRPQPALLARLGERRTGAPTRAAADLANHEPSLQSVLGDELRRRTSDAASGAWRSLVSTLVWG